MQAQTIALISVGALAVLSGIGYFAFRTSQLWPREYAGHFSMGFETSAFTPCAPGERWWVSGVSKDMSERYRAASQGQDYQAVYLRVRGRVSAAGRYGHLGAYDRELQVLEVLELRPAQASDCP